MAWALVAGTAISAAPAIYKGIKGIGQTNKANSMKPVDPGYQMNQALIDNARTLSDTYSNYQMPGYNNAKNDIDTNFQSAFSDAVNGASSSADVLDAATKMAYGKNDALNRLNTQNAQGKETALSNYLNANARAGQEYVNSNEYDRDRYQNQLKEKAALTEAGAENTFGAADQIAGVLGKFAFSQADDNDNSSSGVTTKDGVSVYGKNGPVVSAGAYGRTTPLNMRNIVSADGKLNSGINDWLYNWKKANNQF